MRLACRVATHTAVILAFLVLWSALDAQKKPPPSVPINVNTATIAQLKTLPGLGDVMAKDIVRYREKNGSFRRVEELLIIRGISKKRLESWKPYLKTN
jgi:competence ComEA-like helix-hairpin-helix protein